MARGNKGGIYGDFAPARRVTCRAGGPRGGRGGAGRAGLQRRAGYGGGRAAGLCQGGPMTRAQLDKRPGDVAAMFDKVAPRYDLLNDVLSLGQDRWWRKVVAKAVGARAGERVLDLAAGTGTSSVTFTAGGAACVACDFSLGMLRAGVERLGTQDARGRPPGSGAAGPGRAGLGAMPGPVRFVAGDALRLPFGDQAFDAVTISF